MPKLDESPSPKGSSSPARLSPERSPAHKSHSSPSSKSTNTSSSSNQSSHRLPSSPSPRHVGRSEFLNIRELTDADRDQVYYYGLPSRPRLLATTRRDDLDSLSQLLQKSLFTISPNHPIVSLWYSTIGPVAMELIDSTVAPSNVCLDAVRLGSSESTSITTIWVGIGKDMISAQAATNLVDQIKVHCIASGAIDVEVEIRETQVTLLSKLLDPDDFPPIVTRFSDIYCHTIGIPIASEIHAGLLGTAGLFLRMPEHPRLHLLTAHHVLNKNFAAELSLGDEAKRRNVFLSRRPDYDHKLATEVAFKRGGVRHWDDAIEQRTSMGRDPRPLDLEQRGIALTAQSHFDNWQNRLRDDYPENTCVGRGVVYPPIGFNVGTSAPAIIDGYTEDWGVFECDLDDDPLLKVNRLNLLNDDDRGIVQQSPEMYPPPPDNSETYLPVTGTLSAEELAERPLVVVKRGAVTDLTIGTTNPVQSFLRHGQNWTLEQPVIAFGEKGHFSAPGDSGAIVMDRRGKLCGMMTSGANGPIVVRGGEGLKEIWTTDVTYCSPMWWLWERMRAAGINPSAA